MLVHSLAWFQVQERVERTLTKSPPSSSSTSSAKPAAAAASFGSLPWSGSVTGEGKEQLLYMPFLEWQLRHLHKTGSKVTEVPLSSEIRYKCSETKPAHVGESGSQAAGSQRGRRRSAVPT